ncbi:50S ribosomal protein L5 [bacterium]|nr:50S ribosomal protein L5 [bacterium]
MGHEPRLKIKYKDEILPALMESGRFKSVMAAPKLIKVTINCGINEAKEDAKILEGVLKDIALITSQKPVITRAKNSISNFKIREEMPVGCKVTLRKTQMWEFVDRFFNIVIPRIRDFRGLSPKSFDGRGNYSMGLKDQMVFPEIDFDKIVKAQGMNICITTTAQNDKDGYELLKLLGLPFRER